MTKKRNNQGFTLIELLVVVSVIALITTITVVLFINTRKASRDAVRARNISEIRRTLDVYLDDYGTFPTSAGECLSNGTGAGATILANSAMLSKIPADPSWPSTGPSNLSGDGYAISPSDEFCYWYYSNSPKSYYLSYYLERSTTSGDAGINVMTQDGLLND